MSVSLGILNIQGAYDSTILHNEEFTVFCPNGYSGILTVVCQNGVENVINGACLGDIYNINTC